MRTQSSFDRDYSRRNSDAGPGMKDATGLLVLLAVGVVCLGAYAWGVVQLVDWFRK